MLRLSENEHIVLLSLHHIVGDQWSIGILAREVSALYKTYKKQEPLPLPDLVIQYADYAVWQREWLQNGALDQQLGYWRKQLGGELPLLELPTSYPRPAVQSYQGARQSIAIDKDLAQALKLLSRNRGSTLFMTLLTAFNVLLYRYTGQHDIVIGTPVAGRSRLEIEGLIGCFVNQIVLRTNLDGNLSVGELIEQVREVVIGAYAPGPAFRDIGGRTCPPTRSQPLAALPGGKLEQYQIAVQN